MARVSPSLPSVTSQRAGRDPHLAPAPPPDPAALWDHQGEGRAPCLCQRPILLWSQQRETGLARLAPCPAHTPRGPPGSFLNQTSSGLTETPPGGLTAHREGAAGSPLCFLLSSILAGPPSAQERGSVAGGGRGGSGPEVTHLAWLVGPTCFPRPGHPQPQPQPQEGALGSAGQSLGGSSGFWAGGG